jgi:hypothetical protein
MPVVQDWYLEDYIWWTRYSGALTTELTNQGIQEEVAGIEAAGRDVFVLVDFRQVESIEMTFKDALESPYSPLLYQHPRVRAIVFISRRHNMTFRKAAELLGHKFDVTVRWVQTMREAHAFFMVSDPRLVKLLPEYAPARST